MESRGYVVHGAASVSEGIKLGKSVKPAYAVVDMRLEDGNGLDVVENLRAENPDARIIMLTGYGNIATAVEAVKRGAVDYLAKPADADEIHAALVADDGERASPPENPMSADRVRWEHIQRVFELCDRNVSETARRLNMHGAPCSVFWPSARRASFSAFFPLIATNENRQCAPCGALEVAPGRRQFCLVDYRA